MKLFLSLLALWLATAAYAKGPATPKDAPANPETPINPETQINQELKAAPEIQSNSEPLATPAPSTTPEPAPAADKIQNLEIIATPEIDVRYYGTQLEYVARLTGSYLRETWTLKLTSPGVFSSPNRIGSFEVRVPVISDKTDIVFQATGPQGEIETQTVTIDIPNWKEVTTHTQDRRRLFSFNVGTDLSLISVKDPRIADYSETAITLKGGVNYRFKDSNWELRGSAFYTALPLGSNLNKTARFLGLNLKTGVSLPAGPSRWKITLLGGFYYTTMFVPSNDFGYKDVGGPQLYPEATWFLPNGNAASAFLKFSPVTDGSAFPSFSNREFAAGGQYLIRLRDQKFLAFSATFSSFSLTIKGLDISSNTFSAGLSYGF